MRQIFSLRFFLAVAAIVGLFVLLATIFQARDLIKGGDGTSDGAAVVHRIDLVGQVLSSSNPSLVFDADGLVTGETSFQLDPSRALRVVPGTPGENLCPVFPQPGACAVIADLLGEGVVWLALVPMGSNNTVDLPAIDALSDGLATLVNGWQVPYASVLDRRCRDEEFASYREFRDVMGDDFVAVFDIESRELVAVKCRTKVAYAPVDSDSDSAAAG
jgi:hypothetical protein